MTYILTLTSNRIRINLHKST